MNNIIRNLINANYKIIYMLEGIFRNIANYLLKKWQNLIDVLKYANGSIHGINKIYKKVKIARPNWNLRIFNICS